METLHTPTYAALLGGSLLVLQILLMLSVGTYRTGAKKGVGVDGDMKLERLVRRHGNLAENAAIFLIVLTLYEVMFGQTLIVLGTASVFLVARLLHAIGFSSLSGSHLVDAQGSGSSFVLMRAAGAGLTALSSLVIAIALIVSVVPAL
ncbi:MAG: MAPEG family protein [Hyphomonadaceae bacterium]|nr:MAPEG family protein [Hyphomonadaceae bacterium]